MIWWLVSFKLSDEVVFVSVWTQQVSRFSERGFVLEMSAITDDASTPVVFETVGLFTVRQAFANALFWPYSNGESHIGHLRCSEETQQSQCAN